MTIEPSSEPLLVRSLQTWDNWEQIARDRHGVNTLTVLAVEAAWRTAALNNNGTTVDTAKTDPDHLVSIRVFRTNVNILANVTERHHFVLLSIEPHPFLVETAW